MIKVNTLNLLNKKDIFLFYGFVVFCLASILLSFHFEQKAFLALPFVPLVALFGLLNFKNFYFLLLASIPLSTEVEIGDSFGTDLPSEPLMVGLMLLVMAYLFKNARKIDFSFFRNWLSLFLILHLVWIFASIFSSLLPFFSVKYFLAKMWYVFSFFLATAILIKNEKDVRTLFWSIYLPLSFTVIIALVRHALVGFSFNEVNRTLEPFYRNHVSYAAILVMFIPFVFFARHWYNEGSFKRRLLNISVIVYVLAIYFSYTRACYLALIAMIGAYVIVKLKLIKPTIIVSLVAVFLVLAFITKENYYLKFSPTTNTVSQHEFTDLIDATFKAEDVSSMERIYRWIAAVHMANERPITGFGTNGFVPHYKNYTVFIFETWISENEENSGVHNYFLMLLVEQGIPGLVFFLLLLIAFFTMGQKVYHQQTDNTKKGITMAAMLSMVALVVNLLFSDMIEVDKTGSLFFVNLCLLILVNRNFKSLVN